MATKRKRSSNWSEQDKLLLKELVKKRISAIEDKNNDTATNLKKKRAWEDIEKSFNGLCQGAQRNVTQLRAQWTFSKIVARKTHSAYRNQIAQSEIRLPKIEIPADYEIIVGDKEIEFKPNLSHTLEHSSCDILEEHDAMVEDNTLKLSDHLTPEEMRSTVDEISSISETELQTNREAKEIQKRKKKPVASQDVAANKIKMLSDIQMKNIEELHKIQMENERKRGRNLDLEYEILKKKKLFLEKI
ncbi:hypothetical protein DOY81_002423 [Sarcophaga bullata]|nr:hypothetical protein DOY81_002423 [Sarcophaga bullata]